MVWLRVRVEADLSTPVVGVWPFVNYTLGVVDVAVLCEAARETGTGWVRDVNHMQTTSTRAAADRVCEPGLGVDVEVVCVAELRVMGGLCERHGGAGHAPHLS